MTNYEYLDSLIQTLDKSANDTAKRLEEFLRDMNEQDRSTAVGKRALQVHDELCKFLVNINKI